MELWGETPQTLVEASSRGRLTTTGPSSPRESEAQPVS